MTASASGAPGGSEREREGAGGSSDVLPDSVDHPLFRIAPRAFIPFLQLARIDRPIGWQLLLLPCWQSSLLASVSAAAPPHWRDLLLFLIGAVAMRGAGSTYNDIVDREIDARVERTRGRPLPSGRASPRAAALFLAAQCLVGLAVLLSLNPFSIALGFSSLLFVGLYPFMKRITSWPQLVLGFAFAFGALMGWASAFGALALAPALLYVGSILWTIGYDTIYALMDVKDDEMIGVGSTARLFGEKVRPAVASLYTLSFAFTAAALFAAGAGGLALAGLAGLGAHLGWQVLRLRPDGGAGAGGVDALRLFRANRDAGFILVAGLFCESLRLSLF